jgi:hypothetical protein
MSPTGDAENERAHADRLAPASVIRILLHQHAEIRDAFAAVRAAPRRERQEAFDRLRELLAVHEAAEEMVLRPVSRESAGARIAEARNQEEAEAARLLAELEKTDVAGEQFTAGLAEVERAVSEHAEREELEEFPAVQSAHTDEELQELGAKLLVAADTAPTHPHPAAAGSPTAQRVLAPFAALLDKARDARRD